MVCLLSNSLPKQIKFDGTSRRSLHETGSGDAHFPKNIIFHPEGHKFITISFEVYLFSFKRIQEFEIEK